MKNILLCDSYKPTRDLVKTVLSCYGFIVSAEESSSSVTDSLNKSTYDVLICDYFVKPVSSFELFRTIRGASDLMVRDTRILMMTYGALDLEEHKFLRQHHVYLIPKFKGPEKYFEKINLITKE